MCMNELIVRYKVATCHYTVAMSCNCMHSYQIYYQIYSSQQVWEQYALDINWYWILYQWKTSIVIIWCKFCCILVLFLFHLLLLILSRSITIVQHLRLDYCKKFIVSWKETIDKLKWNMSCFKKYCVAISLNILFVFKNIVYINKKSATSCSIVSVWMRYHNLRKRYLQK